MLIPQEKPYLTGLNSYFLYFEKLIEHLQGDIGSGCLYCKAPDQEILVYFYEQELVRAVLHKHDEPAHISQDLGAVLRILSTKNFQITVYYLDPAAIFYWAEMPSFQRNKTRVNLSVITLPELANRLLKRKFSGFVDITMGKQHGSAILFFHKGKRCGGSYSWGKGGLSPSENDYEHLCRSVRHASKGSLALGRFINESVSRAEQDSEISYDELEDDHFLSELAIAINEFLGVYSRIIRKKNETNPTILLKQQFLDNIDEFPILDPFKNLFLMTTDGTFEFAGNANRKEMAAGIVACTWRVIQKNKLETKFRAVINKLDYKATLEECGIPLIF